MLTGSTLVKILLVMVLWASCFPLITVGIMSLSLLGTSLVYCLWASVLRSVELYKANSFSFLIPVIGLTAGAFFFDERLSSEQWLGVTVIVVGIVVLACFSRDRDSASL